MECPQQALVLASCNPACIPKDEVENMVKLQKPPQKFKWKSMSAQSSVNLVSLL